MTKHHFLFFIFIIFFRSCKCGLIGLAEVVFENVGASKEVNVFLIL